MVNEELYTKGTRVWLPDPDTVWIGGTLLEDLKNNELEIELEDGREIVLDLNITKQLPPLRNPEILVGSNDLTTLSYLHEPAVLHNLKERFLNSRNIYTYCGIVLVALNPYENVPLYSTEIIHEYGGRSVHDIDPHIFAVAENAFRSMVNLEENQSIIVSGESGAGKTVSAKYTMRYFANVGGSSADAMVEQKVLASNPIMEAIGNAKTIRNDNSSRFGKYIEINFDKTHKIIGANMRTYLLEKSRVVYQAPDERNYHIFYQLCASCHLPELEELKLSSPDNFFYTQQGENPVIEGVDDAKDFQDTCDALSLLGIYSEQQRMIWRILAAILHLGNIKINPNTKSGDQCSVKDDIHATIVATLLGIDHSQLRKWLCARKIIATGDVYVKPLTLKEANNGRDALAKHIYSQLFKWVVEHINNSLANSSKRHSFIGVLDIYGFETFEVNSFEQFCINYANEKLQQQFNQHVFKLEQEEYIREQITWSFIDFYDNQKCIDLIEAKLGILDLLDEECRMPKGCDPEWALKLYKEHVSKSEHFVKPRLSQTAFIIRHYADDVIYDCMGFVEKNRDVINEEHLNLLCASEYELVGNLFKRENTASSNEPRKRTTSRTGKNAPKGKKTVGSEFRDSLQRLMSTLNSTSPHYVRCIKSNDAKESFQLDLQRCVQQLRACGVLETIRISAAGYPSRWTYKEFFDRYRMLISWKRINWNSLHDTCNTILSEHIADEDKFQLGKTKIFFRAGSVAYLERLRNDLLRRSCIMIQKNVKCWLVFRRYQKMRNSAITMQCFVRCYQAKRLVQFLRETRASIRIQKIWRGYRQRKIYLTIIEQVIAIQAQIRGVLQRRRLRAHIEFTRAIVIQKYWRMYKAKEKYQKTREGIILLQCCVRRMAAKKELKKLKIEARSVEHYKTLTKGMEMKVITLQQKINEQAKAKQELQEKVEHMKSMEDELNQFHEIKPQLDELKKTTETLRSAKEEILKEKTESEEKNKDLQEKLDRVNREKDEEIERLKAALEALQRSLDEEKSKNEQTLIEQKELLEQSLQNQREEMLEEFTAERTSHQKMISDYSRLEQRYDNLQQELNLEKHSPDKRRLSHLGSTEMLATMSSEENGDDEYLANLTDSLNEVSRERDLLLEQVELLKNEQKITEKTHEFERRMSNSDGLNDSAISSADFNTENENLRTENENMKVENENIKKELDLLKSVFEECEAKTFESNDRAMTKLLKEIKELREENSKLQRKTHVNETMKLPLTRKESGDVPDLAEREISRLTLENLAQKEEIEKLKEQLKDALSRSITSPPKRTNRTNDSPQGLRSQSSANEMRKRAKTMESRMQDGTMSEAGKVLMTYAGLNRKKATDNVKDPMMNGFKKKRLGFLKFLPNNMETVVKKIVSELKPEHVEKEVPGLPAHIIFMGIRYIDNINQERLLQSYLTAVISAIKKRAAENSGDIDNQAFWLANTFRLYSDMKQYSGDLQFQSMNTPDQNEHCLMNFDLSEYRLVLSDTCIKIYQDMVNNIQTRISNLIVPGMLEYESIPGVVSTSRKFKSEQKLTEEIITVKDITNKLSAILAVLNAHCVEPSLIKQIFKQIYYYINSVMINNILLRKDMCHWSRGIQIKFNLTQLEEWCRTNQLHVKDVIAQLEPITEVVQLLQVNKKNMDDLDGIIAIVSKLNPAQVQKLLSMYTPPNDYEPRVPGNLIRAVVSKLPKEENMYLMFDLKYINPMTVSFVPSTVNLDNISIPVEIGLEKITEVL